MMIEERLFQQDWFVDLSIDERYMFLYLLSIASKKTGIFEMNMRMINFGANTNKKFTKEDILTIYGNRIVQVPNHENTAIFPSYIRSNWLKGGKGFDSTRNPLFKSISAELARYDLTIDKINELTDKKIEEVIEDVCDDNISDTIVAAKPRVEEPEITFEDEFNRFWLEYPGPRKTDKRKCKMKFIRILKDADNYIDKFNDILKGLNKWKKTDTWIKDGGQFICAPLVWLNNERWEAEVKELTDGNFRQNCTANNNYKSAEADNLF